MQKRIAINGFGRIGRAAFKAALLNRDIKVAAINDLTEPANLAYLLKYDSVYGRYDKKVDHTDKSIRVGNADYPVFAEPDPAKLPWRKLKIDAVLECTGFFTLKEDAAKHLAAGAKTVVVSAPSKSPDMITVVRGVNQEQARGEQIVSNASCTTNCVAPVMKVLNQEFGVVKALMSTIHAYTSTQALIDAPAKKDFRRGRAAAENVSPSSTGAAIAATKTIPELAGHFDGIAIRVPVPCGSLTDVVCLLKKDATVEQINAAFKRYSKKPELKGILAVSDDDLVSRDIIGANASAIVDLPFTRVVDGNLVKVLAWYDNEWAYSVRLVEMALIAGR